MKFQDRRWLHALLLLLTILSTYITYGWIYSASVIAILGSHELGHYLACRYYDVDASLPYFLPLPVISPAGTLGAFIRIREPIPYKRWLFDIGIAGPLAGFLVALPIIFIGIALSTVVPLDSSDVFYGEPLLLKFASRLIHGPLPATQTLLMHPLLFAGWFGMLATALNLMPIGQLDGGHISYAVFGRRSTYLTALMVAVSASLILLSRTWVSWTVLVVAGLLAFGVRHPPVIDEDAPLDPARKTLAALALVIFVLCFMPVPIEFLFKGR